MRRLGLLGLSYRTADQSAIARSALEAPLGEAIRRAHERYGFAESVYIATCNRVEWVFVPPEDADPQDCFAAIQQQLPVEAAQCYQLTGEDAARHVFEVAASLDSMNPGETQVVGQVREAYRRSSELGLVGPRLHLLFEAALLGLRGLYLLGNGYRGIALNDCVTVARATAESIAGGAEEPAGRPAAARSA